MSAIQSDAANIDVSKFLLPGEGVGLDEDAAAEEVLKTLLPPGKGKDADRPSSKKTEKKERDTSDDADDEDDAETPTSDDEDDDEEDDKDSDDEDGDDAEAQVTIKVKVGDETKEVPASQLARLYGQESALTKKSMEVAEQRRTYETRLTEQASATQMLLERANQRFAPFAQLDFNLLATQVTPEEYNALRQSAQAAYEDVAFLQHGMQSFMQQINTNRSVATTENAKVAIRTLSGPTDKGGIEGWSEKLYDDIRAHAISTGAPADWVNGCTDAATIRMLHAAMLYARGRDKSKVVTTKVNKRPKRIVKSSTNAETTRREERTGSSKKAMARLQQTGSTDDAAALLMSRWRKDDD